uniref:Uncharacterized protein n=2 Tax=viral metagenome TaxID=1070528 RepID=A0A6M3JPI1_9ZZZZ
MEVKEMKYTIRCNKCDTMASVNGQKQISVFTGNHKHGNELAGMTGENIELDNPQDRIALGIDPKPLYTGSHIKPVRDYWRKVQGSI